MAELKSNEISEYDLHTDKADTLSMRMYHLKEVVSMAAFAAEARRTLNGIHDALEYHKEVEKMVHERVPHACNWLEMKDTTGEVLRYVVGELESINDGFTSAVYDAASKLPKQPSA